MSREKMKDWILRISEREEEKKGIYAYMIITVFVCFVQHWLILLKPLAVVMLFIALPIWWLGYMNLRNIIELTHEENINSISNEFISAVSAFVLFVLTAWIGKKLFIPIFQVFLGTLICSFLLTMAINALFDENPQEENEDET